MSKAIEPKSVAENATWTPTKVQFLYRHKNGRYYVRTYAGGKEKWNTLRTTLLSVAKNRMKTHLDAAERLRGNEHAEEATGKLISGDALVVYRRELEKLNAQPKTKAFRQAGIKLVLRTWPDVEALNVRKITAKMVEQWLRDLYAQARPYVPNNAKSPARNSTGASQTTIKCTLDALRHVLDIAVTSGRLYANPARTPSVVQRLSEILRQARRNRAERGTSELPTKEQFAQLVKEIRDAGGAECCAAADFVELMAFSGARKNEANNIVWDDIDLTGR